MPLNLITSHEKRLNYRLQDFMFSAIFQAKSRGSNVLGSNG